MATGAVRPPCACASRITSARYCADAAGIRTCLAVAVKVRSAGQGVAAGTGVGVGVAGCTSTGVGVATGVGHAAHLELYWRPFPQSPHFLTAGADVELLQPITSASRTKIKLRMCKPSHVTKAKDIRIK